MDSLITTALPTSFSRLEKEFSFSCCTGTCMWLPVVADPELQLAIQFSSVQSLSCVRLFATPWTVAHKSSLSITNSWSLLKLMSIELVMLSNNLILSCPLLLLPSVFPSIRAFSNESALCASAGVKLLELQLQHQFFQ